jgi:hypothetical protein
VIGDGTFSFAQTGDSFDATLSDVNEISNEERTTSGLTTLPDACFDFERDVWFEWTALEFGLAELSLCPAGDNSGERQVAIYDSSPCEGVQDPIVCARGSCGDSTTASFFTKAGEIFWIRIGSLLPPLTGTFSVSTQHDDQFEPNEGCLRARFLNAGTYFGVAIDQDWYRCILPPLGSATFTVSPRASGTPFDFQLSFQLGCGLSPTVVDTESSSNGGASVTFSNPFNETLQVFASLIPNVIEAAYREYRLDLDVDAVENGALESNDTCENAPDISPNFYFGLVLAPGESEWYQFDVPLLGMLDVTFSGLNTDDVEFFVYRSVDDGTPCPNVSEGVRINSIPGGVNFRIGGGTTPPVRATGYYVHVRSEPGAPVLMYSMDVQIEDRLDNNFCANRAPIETGTLSELILQSPEKPDFFEIEVPTGQTLFSVKINREGGVDRIVNVYLVEPCTGVSLASGDDRALGQPFTFSNDGPTRPVAMQIETGGGDPGIVHYSIEVELFSDCNGNGTPDQSELSVVPCAGLGDDRLEENDVCDDTAPLVPGLATGLTVQPGDEDWYRIEVPEDGEIDIELTYNVSIGDLDVSLYAVTDGSCPGALVDILQPTANGGTPLVYAIGRRHRGPCGRELPHGAHRIRHRRSDRGRLSVKRQRRDGGHDPRRHPRWSRRIRQLARLVRNRGR